MTALPETTPAPGARVGFWFEGRRLEGSSGQSIAAALFAAGERTLSYSVKYHRPRGLLCGRGRCSTCAVNVDGIQGVKACTTPLAEGMRVRRQDSRPWFAPLLTFAARRIPFPAGFYYRFFTRPRFVRESFLGTLRRMAGVGTIDTRAAARPTDGPRPAAALAARYDVVVVGAGVSGMAAAVAAAGAGASVALVDEYAHLGGHSVGALHDAAVARARDDLISAVRADAGIHIALGVTVQSLYADRTLMVQYGSPAVLQRVNAASVVLATGSFDAVPLFGNNDVPGVMGGRALRLFMERDRITPGTRALVLGAGREADDAVALLGAHGVAVAARLTDDTIDTVLGEGWVRGARVNRGGRIETVECDLIVAAVPGQPDFTLAQQAGFSFAFDGSRGGYAVMVPTLQQLESGGQRVFLAGETAGVTAWLGKVEHAATQGALAGRKVS